MSETEVTPRLTFSDTKTLLSFVAPRDAGVTASASSSSSSYSFNTLTNSIQSNLDLSLNSVSP